MHIEHVIHHWAVYGVDRPSQAHHTRGSLCLRDVTIACLIAAFLAVTTLPRFGTVWHTHADGHATHTHSNLSAAPQHHQDHHRLQSLPFGGQYARPNDHVSHHVDHADTSGRPAYVRWNTTDLHWHLYAICLPHAAVVVVPFVLSLSIFSNTTFAILSRWSTPILCCHPRAPPR